MGLSYVGVPWPEEAVDPQPEMRRELEALGFTLIGGCRLAPSSVEEVRAVAPSYGDRADDFAHWAPQPGQVFAAPDGSAYAQLAWLWECRYAAFTTVLTDGRLIQTVTAWGADPSWPTTLAPYYRWTDRRTEQLVMTTDRDAQVVEGAGPAWVSHQGRVAEAGSVRDHTDLGDFVALWGAESAARSAWSTRIQVASGAIAFVAVALLTVIAFASIGPQPRWVHLAVGLVAVAAAIPVYVRVWMRARRWRWLRPRFRAPAPSS